MWLFVGLGNPGPGYAGNRHNIGFMAVDTIVHRHRFSPWKSSRFNGHVAEGSLAGEKVLALKPTTYMNESGNAVGAALRFYKIDPGDVVVFYDEIDLAPGKLRIKRGGGAAGHNGIRSIDAHIGTDYRRVRLGVGHPGDKSRVQGWVLGNFSKEDQSWLGPWLDAVADAAPLLATADEAAFQNKVTVLLQPPQPAKPRAAKPGPDDPGASGPGTRDPGPEKPGSAKPQPAG